MSEPNGANDPQTDRAGGKSMSGQYEDHIYIGDMHSFHAWAAFAERQGWDEWFHSWISPEWLCWFIEILKQSDDDPALFPHGKWASIQVLQGKVAAMAAGLRHTISVEAGR